ncbi:uncharacterized protein PAC_17022 [Phialocephala subalpina]|uniref:Integral membrane protein n=1 Tax=Phialocephala subalpina TaxID=576137 RepID=A0A1L7XQ21_9HELO|nr:uncharacterized protein PAC_17022 [Phialocephala subalpina]
MEITSVYFGLFLGLLVPTMAKIILQTRSIWKRTRSLSNPYLYMIWTEVLVNLIFSLTTFLYLGGVIKGSLAYFFGVVTMWAIQTQFLSQIIANRVSLIMVNKRKSRLLKWSLFVLISIVNIAVYCIWIPAHMPSASPTMILLNDIWEHIEKCFFLVIDFGLNLYFLYLLRYRLIADGLSKYWRLFKFNAAIAVVSLSMDVLLLGFLSLPNPYDYVQFAPVAYIVKLYIELTMADLISKVVRSGSAQRGDEWYSGGNHTSSRTHPKPTTITQPDSFANGSAMMDTNISAGRVDRHRDEDQGAGIMKTVTTVVQSDMSEGGGSCEEYQVNTKRLTRDYSSTKSLNADDSTSQ